MARKKSNQELVAAVAAGNDGGGGAKKKGRRKGKKAMGTCLDTSDVNKAIGVVGRTIRKIEQATGGKFIGRQMKASGSFGGGGSPRKKASKKARKKRVKK